MSINLSLIAAKCFEYQNRQIFLSLEEAPPHIQAYVIEQDTALLLETPQVIMPPLESTAQLLAQALVAPSFEPGEVLIKTGPPLQLLAIIHDLEQTPTWQDPWIRSALMNLWKIIEQHQIVTLAMPLLGTVHGKLSTTRFFELFKETLTTSAGLLSLQQIWLLLEEDKINREQFEALGVKLNQMLR